MSEMTRIVNGIGVYCQVNPDGKERLRLERMKKKNAAVNALWKKRETNPCACDRMLKAIAHGAIHVLDNGAIVPGIEGESSEAIHAFAMATCPFCLAPMDLQVRAAPLAREHKCVRCCETLRQAFEGHLVSIPLNQGFTLGNFIGKDGQTTPFMFCPWCTGY